MAIDKCSKKNEQMIRISPNIEFSAKCPVDDICLETVSLAITGMRSLVEASCPVCGASYYVDLPIGQAIRSPITLKQKTGEIFDPKNVLWFSNLLKDSYSNQINLGISPKVHKFFECDRIVIINCLDFLYGHSLLKLLNVQRYLDQFTDIGCCVLVPSQLLHLVPDGVAEIWEFPVRIQDGWKWYRSLQTWINQQLISRSECFLSRAYSHPSNRMYDINRFVPNLPDISNEIDKHQPVVLFSYREDRPWGRDHHHQKRNIQKLYNRLGEVFPNLVFVIVGFGKNIEFCENSPKLIDLRHDNFSREQELLWLSYMQRADCVVGVHGSNMLLPSGLAKTIVELVPRSRLGNCVQDFLFPASNYDPRDALLLYRMIYGNDSLSDILPSEVVDMVACVLSSAQYNSAWFKVGEMNDAIHTANSASDSEIFKNAKKYFSHSKDNSFIKRQFKTIADRILEITD